MGQRRSSRDRPRAFRVRGPALLLLLLLATGVRADDATRAAAATLTSLLTASVSRHRSYDVLSSGDLRAVIALEADKQKLGCDEADGACLAEIAGALGARLVLLSQLGVLGDSVLLSLTLFDADQARSVGRQVIRAATVEELADALDAQVDALVARAPRAKVRTKLLVLDVRVPAGLKLPSPQPTARAWPANPGQTGLAPVPSPPPTLPVVPVLATDAAMRPVLPLGGLAEGLRCLHRAVPRVVQSEARYRSWVDAEQGPSCQERYIGYGLYAPYDDAVERCQAAAEALAEHPALAEQTAALAGQVQSFYPLLKQAVRYYGEEDYLDDDCATGQRLHPKLLEGFAALRATTRELAPALDAAILATLKRPQPDRSARRQALAELATALVEVARSVPLFQGDSWDGLETLVATQRRAHLRWVQLRDLPAPEQQLQGTIWRAHLLGTEPQLAALKRKLRALRKQAPKLDDTDLDAFDPLEIRMPLYDLLLDIERMRPVD